MQTDSYWHGLPPSRSSSFVVAVRNSILFLSMSKPVSSFNSLAAHSSKLSPT
ncbi:hypothetical protein GBA52_002676 [Prunus armeniaca]|nr:hypothetical protein GBA52_002676 [Prunus armeniaca]